MGLLRSGKRFFSAFDVQAALQPADPLNEQPAIQMVNFMLETDCFEPDSFHLDRFPVRIECANDNTGGALDLRLILRD